MSRRFVTILAIGALAAALTTAQLARANTTLQQNEQPFRRTITVVGNGRATATPDIARVTVGVDAVNSRLNAALAEVNRKSAAVMAALEKAGVAKRDIRTIDFSVFPQQPFDRSGPSSIASYRVINAVQVTVRNTDNVGTILDAAISAGANTVYGLTFTVEDIRAIEAQARRGAMADAKSKAEALASAIGAKVGRVLTINENVSGGQTPFFAAPSLALDAAGSGNVSVAPGSRDIIVQVQVVYEIE